MAATVSVSGADIDLFHVAARQYGDASAWRAIALANGLTSADLPSGVTKLTIPAWQPLFTGSAPTQS